VREKVRKRILWIQKQRRFFERFLPSLPPGRAAHRSLAGYLRLGERLTPAIAMGMLFVFAGLALLTWHRRPR
jgi:hypothetical protein